MNQDKMGNRADITEAKPGVEIYPGTGAARELATRRRRFLWGGLVLALAVLGVGLVWGFHCRELLWGGICKYYDICTDKERIQQLLKTVGPLAPLFFLLVQKLQVVFAPIPGEATGFIGGLLFWVA